MALCPCARPDEPLRPGARDVSQSERGARVAKEPTAYLTTSEASDGIVARSGRTKRRKESRELLVQGLELLFLRHVAQPGCG